MPDSTNDSQSDKPRIRFTGGGGDQGGSSLPPLGGDSGAPESESPGFEIEEDPSESTPDRPVQVAGGPTSGESGTGVVGSSKIRTFGQRSSSSHHEKWNRTPNVTGGGAIHVRTFHGKLTNESLEFMDQQINEWLDKHPEYEVKMVTSTIGTFSGKIKEPALICQVWI